MDRKWLAALILGLGLALGCATLAGAARAEGSAGPAPAAASPLSVIASGGAATPTWIIERVDAPKMFGNLTDRSVVVDESGDLHVAYGQDHLYYAHRSGSAWSIETVDAAWGVGSHAAIALDASNYPCISYYDDLNDDLKVAHWAGTQWLIETVDSVGDVGKYTSIGLDGDDVHVTYFDDSYDDLKHAWNDGGAGRPSRLTARRRPPAGTARWRLMLRPPTHSTSPTMTTPPTTSSTPGTAGACGCPRRWTPAETWASTPPSRWMAAAGRISATWTRPTTTSSSPG